MPRRAPPIPPAVVRGIAGLAWVQGRLDVALGILIGFHCMLRGCEVLGLRFCDCTHFSDTVVLELGFTKTGSRKGTREQVTITDSSLTSLFRFFCRECKSSESIWCVCLNAISGNIIRASFLSSISATKVIPYIPCGAVVLHIFSV